MSKILFWLLRPTFGSKRFLRLYRALFNLAVLGLNFRNTSFDSNGEKFLLSRLKNLYDGKDPLLVFDVGANIGNYASMVEPILGCPVNVFAFEPFPLPFKKLSEIASVSNVIKAFQFGFGEKAEKLPFYSSSAFDEIGSIYKKDFSKFGFTQDLADEVSINTIDNFCETNRIKHIHFLKIDVEGHDFFVLKGAAKMLDRGDIDLIQFEYGTANYASKTYLHNFYELLIEKYRIYRLLRDGFEEIVEYNTDYEIHILSNYIAIKKDLFLKIIS